MSPFVIFVVLFGYSIACLGVGLLALSLFAGHSDSVDRPSIVTELATSFILGMGLLAGLWLLIALFGFFVPLVVGAIVLVSALIGVLLIRRRIPNLIHQIASILRELRRESWGWQVLAVLTILLVLAWVTSLGRPLFGDATAFYMVLPKIIASSNHLTPMPGYESFMNVGFVGEMHYAAMMILGSPDAAKLFVWPTILAGAVMLLALGRKAGLGRRGQWIALGMLFTSSAAIWLSGDGKVDLFAATFGLAAFFWVLQIHRGHRQLAFLLTGLFCGYASIAKLSYVPVLIPSVGLLLIWNIREDLRNQGQWKTTLRTMTGGGIKILIGFVIAILPHLIKNGLLLNNPFSPFGSGAMSWADQSWFGPETTQRIILSYPFALTFGAYWAQYGDLSPLLLAFLPLALLLPRPRSFYSSPMVAVTLAALAGVVIWILFRPSVFAPRYILAILLLLILLPAHAAEFVSQTETRNRLLTIGIMGSIGITQIAIGLYFLGLVFFPGQTYKYLAGRLSACDRDGLFCRAMATINEHADPGDRVLLLSFQSYWLRGDLLQCMSGARDSDVLANLGSDEEWLLLYQRGFRFILADQYTHSDLLLKLKMVDPPKWLHLTPIFEESKVSVYRLDVINPPTRPLIVCRKDISSSKWELTTP